MITKRASDPEKGRWDVPGGFLNHDEDPIEGVKRELQEELGVEVDVTFDDFVQAIPHRYGSDGDWVLALGFRGRLLKGEPQPASDVDALRWVSSAELDTIDFAWPHDRELVRKALQDG